MQPHHINTAMLFAAGLGTRLQPFTHKHPKALAMVNGKTLLQRNIEYLQGFGIYNVVVNVHHFAEQIIEILAKNNGWGSTITISNEQPEVLETGGGLVFAAKHLQHADNIVVMNVDILTNLNLFHIIQHHIKEAALATLAVANRVSSRYLMFNNAMQLCGWKNVKTGEEKIVIAENNLQDYAFSGIHVINTKLLALIQQKGKFSMIDVYLSLANNEKVIGFNDTNSFLIDVGKPESLQQAEEWIKKMER